jgi:hypothetical protein
MPWRTKLGTGRHRASRTSRGVVVVGLIVVAAPVVVGVSAAELAGRPARDDSVSAAVPSPPEDASSEPPRAALGGPSPESRWLEVLRNIDQRRELAWRRGRADLLSSVYTPGAVELDADTRMLDGYRDRGLHVSGVTMRFLSVRAQRTAPRSASLLVVDRLAPAVAIDRAGRRHPLPRAAPTRQRIELRRVGAQWRIAAITPA